MLRYTSNDGYNSLSRIRALSVLNRQFTLALAALRCASQAATSRGNCCTRVGHVLFTTINSEPASGHMPTDRLIEGLMILLAGAVLITPGFLTDLMGLALLIPPVRRVVRAALVRHFKSRIAAGHIQVSSTSTGQEPGQPMGTGFDDSPGSTPRPVKYVKNEALDQ